MIWRTISTPFTSSPCSPAESKTVGPSTLERSTIIGILSLVMVCSSAISILMVLLSPGRMVSLKIVMLLFLVMFFLKGIKVKQIHKLWVGGLQRDAYPSHRKLFFLRNLN